ATPLMHDSKQELAQPFGRIQDWSKGEGKPIPGKTMPQIHVVERDYRQVYDKMNALGPNVETKPLGANGISWSAKPEYDKLKKMSGTMEGVVGDEWPYISIALRASEAVITVSTTTNGTMAVRAWESLENKTYISLRDLAQGREEE